MVHRKRELERARAEHDRDVNPDDPHRDSDVYIRSRVEDRGWFAHATYVLVRYWPLWSVPGLILAALGFTVVTPKRTVDELRAVVDTNQTLSVRAVARLQAQIDSSNEQRKALAKQHESLEDAVTALVRLGCLDPMLTRDRKQLSGVLDAKGDCIR